jgi:hypothetical protein
MRSPAVLVVLLLSLLCAGTSRLDAQETTAAAIGLGGIEGLLSRVESINVYYGGRIGNQDGVSTPARTRLPWAKDYGLEFLVHIGEFGRPSAASRRRADELAQRRRTAMDSLRGVRAERLRIRGAMSAAARDSLNRRFSADSARIEAEPEMPFKATSMTIRKHVQIVGKDTNLVSIDSEFVGNREPPPPEERMIDFDLGIGYGQMDGLRMGGPFELHGSVRELPSISGYATVRLTDRLGLYAGVRTGVITLQDAQLFVTDDDGISMFAMTSTSFEFGAPIGLDVQPVEGLHVTLEGAYMRRMFNSLTFEPASGIPVEFPRSLDLSGFSWSVGLQFPLP